MLKCTMVFILSFCFSVVHSKDLESLKKYLESHSCAFDSTSIKINPILEQSLKGKRLLVFGEVNHYLKFNIIIRSNLLQQFAIQNKKLKTVFLETGRSNAFLFNWFVRDKKSTPVIPQLSIDSTNFTKYFDNRKFMLSDKFSFVGIDCEVPLSFNWAMNILLKDSRDSEDGFVSKLKSSQYLNLSNSNDFDKNWKLFLLKSYRQFAKKLNEKQLITLLGNELFPQVYYLLNNKQLKIGNDRNNGMAENIITSLTSNDSDCYILDIGMAHSTPNQNNTTVGIISKNEKLKGEIVVMNAYCKNCTTNYGLVENGNLKFMKDKEILKCFDEIASKMGDAVLFDLSEVPENFAFLKENGELLLFLTNKK